MAQQAIIIDRDTAELIITGLGLYQEWLAQMGAPRQGDFGQIALAIDYHSAALTAAKIGKQFGIPV